MIGDKLIQDALTFESAAATAAATPAATWLSLTAPTDDLPVTLPNIGEPHLILSCIALS